MLEAQLGYLLFKSQKFIDTVEVMEEGRDSYALLVNNVN
jgi:hypothetical protein